MIALASFKSSKKASFPLNQSLLNKMFYT